MPRPERAVDPDAGPVESFAFGLRQLRGEAGNPPYRELARVAHYSPATLAAAAGGRRLPSLPVVVLLAVSAIVVIPRLTESERRAAPGADRTELIGIDHFGDGKVRAWPNTGGFPAWP